MDDDFWRLLRPLIEAPVVFGTHAGSRRKSERLQLSEEAAFARAWRVIISRSEALHHALAVAGQDEKHLTVGILSRILARWGPPALIDRASPVYGATLLMEVCKVRGTREASLVHCAQHLLTQHGADVNARPPGVNTCTPLIIATCRGLPSVVELFLGHGADARTRGEGRFRLFGSSRTLQGCHSALGWVESLLDAEQQVGVPDEARKPLLRCRKLLQRAVADANEANGAGKAAAT